MSGEWIFAFAPGVLTIAILFWPSGLKCPDAESGRHSWTYNQRSIGGWGVARCELCGNEDLY